MMLHIPNILSRQEVQAMRQHLDAAQWEPGHKTAGPQGAKVKTNLQLPPDSDVARQLGQQVLAALERSALYFSAALPLRTVPPLFNRYQGGGAYGFHVDSAVRVGNRQEPWVRTDLSATLFLCEPEDYEGGELIVSDTYGEHDVKLPAGDMILYPSSSLHRVAPVTQGARVCSFFWIQSMVRNDMQRTMLFDLDQTIIHLREDGDTPHTLALTNHYHNLLRMWAET